MNYNALNFISAAILPDWVTNSFPIIRIVMLILLAVISVGMIIVVLIQPSNSEGMGALGGTASDTYYEKNKGRSIEGLMKRLTIIFGITIAVISILFFVTLVIYPVGYGI